MKLDLTDRLKSEKPSIIFAGKEYEINNSAEILLKIAENEKTEKNMIEILDLLVGQENLREIMSRVDMASFNVFATYVMGMARGSSQEQIEEMLLNKTPSK